MLAFISDVVEFARRRSSLILYSLANKNKYWLLCRGFILTNLMSGIPSWFSVGKYHDITKRDGNMIWFDSWIIHKQAMIMIGCAGPRTPAKFQMYHTLVAAPAFLIMICFSATVFLWTIFAIQRSDTCTVSAGTLVTSLDYGISLDCRVLLS